MTPKTNNLKDNKDGTCNCRPLGNGCFFTNSFGGKCNCKCHFTPKTIEEKILEDFEKQREELGDMATSCAFDGNGPVQEDCLDDLMQKIKDFISFALTRLRESLEIDHQKELMDAAKFMREQIAKEDVEYAQGEIDKAIKKHSETMSDTYIGKIAALSDFISYKHNQIKQ